MAIVGADAFTGTAGTAVEGRTADTGGVWTKAAGPSGGVVWRIRNNRAAPEGFTNTLLYLPATPDSEEYDVSADVVVNSHDPSFIAVVGRASTSAFTCYRASYDGTWSIVRLERIVAGSATWLGEFSLPTWPISSGTYRLKLEIRNAAKKVYWDGTQIISVTDNTITAAGKAGIFAYGGASATVGEHLDNFLWEDLATGGTPDPVTLSIAAGATASASVGVQVAKLLGTTAAAGASSTTAILVSKPLGINAGAAAGSSADLRILKRFGFTAAATASAEMDVRASTVVVLDIDAGAGAGASLVLRVEKGFGTSADAAADSAASLFVAKPLGIDANAAAGGSAGLVLVKLLGMDAAAYATADVALLLGVIPVGYLTARRVELVPAMDGEPSLTLALTGRPDLVPALSGDLTLRPAD